MKGIFILIVITASLLFHHQVEGSEDLPASLCQTKETAKSLLECRANFLQSAGQNFTDDCEDGVVQDFMRCITAIEGCKNLSAFVEKAFYDYYGCMDTDITVYKRAYVRRLVCGTVCGYSCGYRCSYSYLYGRYRCGYTCARSCRYSCRYVYRWVGKRDVAPEDSEDLTPDEQDYINQTRNLCSNCVCSVDVENPPRYVENNGQRPRQLEANSSAMIVGHISLLLILCLVTTALF